MIKGIIWSDNKIKRDKKFEELIAEYGTNTTEIRKSNNIYEAYFENGDYWRTAGITDHFRGFKCNISLVDYDISKNVLQSLIEPCTIRKPFSAIGYY